MGVLNLNTFYSMKTIIFLPLRHTKWWILIACFILNHFDTPSKSLFNHGKYILSILLANILLRFFFFFALIYHGTVSPYTYCVKLVWTITKISIFPPDLLWMEQHHSGQFGIIVFVWGNMVFNLSFKKRRVGREGHRATLDFTSTLPLCQLVFDGDGASLHFLNYVSVSHLPWYQLFLKRVHDFTFLSAGLVLLTHSRSLTLFLFQLYAFSFLPFNCSLITVHWEDAYLSFRRYEVYL